jgi:hypothetical protein
MSFASYETECWMNSGTMRGRAHPVSNEIMKDKLILVVGLPVYVMLSVGIIIGNVYALGATALLAGAGMIYERVQYAPFTKKPWNGWGGTDSLG